MRATHIDPRILLLAALATALAFALAVAGGPLDLSSLDLFSGGASGAEAPATEPAGKPAWVEDPMASPIEALRGR